ncbi:MAG TPA: glutamate--tRNA ligase, partial [Clostridia bacterium]|nr:glutamate--tRNA ligase [Clostridia bacterium]
MMKKQTKTRFAPSPTGIMHVGNLRSALYEYLIAKADHGAFILRIEDTDRERYVEGAVDVIYRTLNQCGLDHDEGPDIGGPNGPYTQSERLPLYKRYGEQLLAQGDAYPCFCSAAHIIEPDNGEETESFGYDRHCRTISPEEAARRMAAGESYVIRQKMPLSGETSFVDDVYGKITVQNKELEDQILLKSDGYPTYNFANVVDDHLMEITHIVRGSEYLSSTPKYCLLYQAFGWEIPHFVHLPLIVGEDGRKLSKRHGSTSFDDLIEDGYLPQAIINMIAFLGWAPGGDTREIFALKELEDIFDIKGINKAPAVFSYNKLNWMNEQYIRMMAFKTWRELVKDKADPCFDGRMYDLDMLAQVLQSRVTKLSEIPSKISFLSTRLPLSRELFFNKRAKLDADKAAKVLDELYPRLSAVASWNETTLQELLAHLCETLDIKKGLIMGA